MEDDVFADTSYGKVALRKLGPVDPHFRLFCAGWLGDDPKQWNVMEVTGAVFRKAMTGPRKGRRVIEVKGTRRTVYVTSDEMAAEDAASQAPT